MQVLDLAGRDGQLLKTLLGLYVLPMNDVSKLLIDLSGAKATRSIQSPDRIPKGGGKPRDGERDTVRALFIIYPILIFAVLLFFVVHSLGGLP